MTLELFLQHFFNALTLGSLYGLIAIGYTMVYGILRLINFAHGDILMLGAYFVFYGTTLFCLPWPIAVVVAIIGSAVLGVLSVVPYLICWIFSKKHFGWLIGALVFFAIDSLLFFIDFIAFMANGDMSMLIDLLFSIYAIGTLAMGIKYGLDLKNEAYQAEFASPAECVAPEASAEAPASSGITRQITVTRKKSFVGCAVPIICYVNGNEVCRLKNGASATFSAPSESFELGASLSNGLSANAEIIPYGEAPLSFKFEIKMGMAAGKIIITPDY